MSEIDFENEVPAPSDEQLGLIAKLARRQVEYEEQVAIADEAFKKAKANLRRIQEKELPAAMEAIGMESFTLKSGETISVKEKLYASISKKDKPAAIRWLMEHEHGSLVKEDVIVSFEKGDNESVRVLQKLLEVNGITNFTVDENVNTASVKAMIKELLSEGMEVPLELFGAYFHRTAEVKR